MWSFLTSDGALTGYAVGGLLAFFLFFLGVCVWILTRGKRQVHDWASIPLTKDEEGPVDDRRPSERTV